MIKDINTLELHLLLDAIYECSGYDFREYAPASLKRRVTKCVNDEKVKTISGLQEKALHDPACMKRLLKTLTVNVTSMFRDPCFYLGIRQKVVPLLKQYSRFRIWHAGCATGEEVLSMAILLKEEGLYDRALIYATDVNEEALAESKEGIFPLKDMKEYTANYQQSGGREEFADYYVAKYDHASFDHSLQDNIVWALHNLATDTSFNEFHLILCRNVMIYFSNSLQTRVHNLIYDSLAISGIMGLGSKESLKFTSHESDYAVLDGKEKIYQKVK